MVLSWCFPTLREPKRKRETRLQCDCSGFVSPCCRPTPADVATRDSTVLSPNPVQWKNRAEAWEAMREIGSMNELNELAERR